MPMRNLLTLFVAAVLSILCYERAARNRYVGSLTEAMNKIDEIYVDPVDERELFEGAIEGMIEKLDPYSAYTNPKEWKRFKEGLDQNFGGIGILVEVNPETKRLTVMNPLVGTPAHKAGIKPGDVILKIGDKDTLDMPLEESVNLMRGPEGSQITITLQHADAKQPFELTLTRARIPIESVFGDTRNGEAAWDFHLEEDRRIGLIRVGTFGERTVVEFRKALETFEEPGGAIEALIIDLRSNPGGLLNAATEICDMFLDDGVIVSTRSRGGVTSSLSRAEPGVLVKRELPIVVLVDRYTASASEIVSACLQDHQRAVICGERSWGKGTVQNVVELEGGRSAIRLTTASYWRPSGKNIHKKKDAKDEDDWGVQPSEGMAVVLTDEEREKMIKQRRERDFAALRPNGSKPPKKEDEPKPDPSSDQPPTPEVQDDPTAKETPPGEPGLPFDDPQMRKAIDYLKQQIEEKREPKAA